MAQESEQEKNLSQMDERTLDDIGRKAQRKLRHRRHGTNALWFGLGTMGLVGWSVAIPTIIGIGVGLYLESAVSAPFSWVLTGLMLGVIFGCLNAWFWVSREREKIQRRREDTDE